MSKYTDLEWVISWVRIGLLVLTVTAASRGIERWQDGDRLWPCALFGAALVLGVEWFRSFERQYRNRKRVDA